MTSENSLMVESQCPDCRRKYNWNLSQETNIDDALVNFQSEIHQLKQSNSQKQQLIE